MTYLEDLPADVARFIRTRFVAEYATVSSAGIPIDTPVVIFPSADLATLDLGTGLAYPTKAERARRNPKVGLLLEGAEHEPVVSISGMAAVRDADLQGNIHRYVEEQILAPYLNPATVDYETITRHAIWYFARIIVAVTPARIRWWRSRGDMDNRPQEWVAPDGAVYPRSDPPPQGKASKAPWAIEPPWRERAEQALARKAPGHLTLLDAEGFPLPIRMHEVTAHPEGFRVVCPLGAPWTRGKATMSFEGVETFVGEAEIENGAGVMRVERALPILPLLADLSQLLLPKPDTKAHFLERLEVEAARRGQPVPMMPRHCPQPTAGALLRDQAARSFGSLSGGAGGETTPRTAAAPQ